MVITIMSFKIVLVANTAWSMFNFRHGVLTRLLRDGYQLTVIAPRDDFSDKLRSLGCTVIDLNMSAKGVNPIEDIKLIDALYRHYRTIKPNFIIHYTIKPNIYGSIAARLACIPSLAITTGLGYTFVNDNLVSKIARCLYKIAFRFPKAIWFLNEDDRSEFVNRGLVSEHKTMVLHGEGVDTKYFSPRPNPNDDGKIRFLLIARMLWDKGVREYVEAARHIKAKYPNTVFQLLGACGVANPSNIGQEQINEWVNEGIVEYLGTAQDVRPIIAQADCVVLPSYREGIPRTMIEAAAMAKPTIVSDAPGCRDVVLHGETGLMCQVKNAQSLIFNLEGFINMDVEKRSAMGDRARQWVISSFDESIVIEKYLKMLFYFDVAGEKSI